jgi:DNA polymerase-3 subunit gamma/tau
VKLGAVRGHATLRRLLARAVARDRLPPSLVLSGPDGVGKRQVAVGLAELLNCEAVSEAREASDVPESCGACRTCRRIARGVHADVIVVAPGDSGTIKVDAVRGVVEQAGFRPFEGRRRAVIVDDADRLVPGAQNALLKTLEEPPAHAVFILATTEAHKVPLTIISRCQRYDFRRIPIDQMVAKLAYISEQEGIEVSDEALHLVARIANGGLRDAENLLEQVVVSYGSPISEDDVRQMLGLGGDEIALELVKHIIGKSVKDGIATVNDATEQGTDLRQLLRGTLEYLRALLLIKTGAGANFGYSDEIMSRLNTLAADAPMEHLVRALKVFAGVNMRRDAASTLPLELAVVESATEPEPVVVAAAPPAPAPPRQAAPQRNQPASRPAASQPTYRQPPQQTYQQPAARASAPSEAPGARPASGGDLPDEPAARLAHQWNMIANDLRFVGTRLKLGAMLRSAKEREVSGHTIILKYPSRSNVERLQQELDNPESKRALDDAIAKAMGSLFQVEVALSNGANGAGMRRASQSSHLVQAAQAMGARVISEREEQQQ